MQGALDVQCVGNGNVHSARRCQLAPELRRTVCRENFRRTPMNTEGTILFSASWRFVRRWAHSARHRSMPLRNQPSSPRLALPLSELERKLMAPLRNLKSCRKLEGADFFYVGSVGGKSNWFARPIPIRVSKACRKSFFSALREARRKFDLLPSPARGHPNGSRAPASCRW